MKTKKINQLNTCFHGFTFGYCPNLCIPFNSLKEKVAEDRRLFLRAFRQTPRTVKQLRARKTWPKLNPVTKETFIRRLIAYRELEKQAPY